MQKWSQNGRKNFVGSTSVASQTAFQIQLLFFIVSAAVLPPPWVPFGLPFGSLWLPLGSLLAPFGTLWLPLGSLGAVCGPPKERIASGGEISPRSCRDSAENVPSTLQEPAENPPYEPQTKLPFTVRLLRKDFVRRQMLRQIA